MLKINRVCVIAAFALIAACAGCGKNSSSVTQSVQYGNVSGYIYTASYNAAVARPAGEAGRAAAAGVPTGYTPVANARVFIESLNLSTQTDANGYFLLENIFQGTQTLKVAKDGLGTLALSVTVQANTTVSLNDQVDEQALSMPPEQKGTLVVTAAAGAVSAPVNATVYINGMATSKVTSPAATIRDITPGTYSVTVKADGYNDPAPQSATIVANQTTSLSFTMVPTDGNNPPRITIVTPTENQSFNSGATVTLTGTGVDSEDGNLTGASLVWSSSVDGTLGTGVSLQTTSLSVGNHTITLTGTDAGGKRGTDTVSIVISSTVQQNTSPTATIVTPTAGSFTDAQTITFAGAGTDAEDGALTGSSMVWTSSLDVNLGTGNFFQKSGLSEGTHTITLTVTDSRGATGTATVQITVSDAAVVNTAPQAFIVTPSNNQTVTTLQTVIFSGTATDNEDITLTGASLVWTSSISGALGTGAFFTKTGMAAGTHTITLTATDSQGATGAATTILIVQ
jgi:hypothetical protein